MKEDWKSKIENELYNQMIDKLMLGINPPIFIKSPKMPKAEKDWKPGMVIKFKWYEKLYNWIWNKYLNIK